MSLAMAAISVLMTGVVEGDAKSPVRVVIYEDLQCSDCANFRTMLDERLLPKYGTKVAFEHRDFPLAKHAWAKAAAVAARHFDRENPKLGVEFRRQTMAKMKAITPETLGQHVAEFARQYGSDPVKAVDSMKDAVLAKSVDADLAEGVARGVVKTPSVFVDGEPFIEVFTVEEISKGIDAALAAYQK